MLRCWEFNVPAASFGWGSLNSLSSQFLLEKKTSGPYCRRRIMLMASPAKKTFVRTGSVHFHPDTLVLHNNILNAASRAVCSPSLYVDLTPIKCDITITHVKIQWQSAKLCKIKQSIRQVRKILSKTYWVQQLQNTKLNNHKSILSPKCI